MGMPLAVSLRQPAPHAPPSTPMNETLGTTSAPRRSGDGPDVGKPDLRLTISGVMTLADGDVL